MSIEDFEIKLRDYLGSQYPVFQASSSAELLIIDPAPGLRAYKTITPWNDPSGERFRLWLDLPREKFYDKSKIAIIPMNFCYPGKDKYGGDKPPGREHADLWHEPLLSLMPNVKLTLLVGFCAQKYYLKDKIKSSMTDTVRAWREYLPEFIVLPHPSWRNNSWLKKHIWFEEEVIPVLRQQVKEVIK